MNRATRRKEEKKLKGAAKAQASTTFNLLDLQRAMSIATEMYKQSGGHLFSSSLKERCIFCGRGRKTTVSCKYWHMTFLDRVQTILINPSFFRDDEIQATWYQHGNEYEGIRLPLVAEKMP